MATTIRFIAALLFIPTMAWADPCGMVPPIYTGPGEPITRTGDQNTYVFFKDGVETFIIQPGFKGKVDEFGMLIPFPSVPELRKVSDSIFPHVRAAIDPPEVVVDLRLRLANGKAGGLGGGARRFSARGRGLELKRDKVRVLKEEAVGMYQVAVLEAGSAAALKKWMDQHGYKYPAGMDKPCEEYVDAGWCFVAIKTKVGQKKGVEPRPGIRTVDGKLPAGASFDGHVQAMGFRFKSDKLVVPMRLSAFNAGELHNIVYVLTERPVKIRSVPEEYVVRQIAGEQLFKNVTDPLPLRIIGGSVKDLQAWNKRNLKQQRDPVPHNGAAKDVFASDLLAVVQGRLSHPHEETEKMYLRIGERLKLRGKEIDVLNEGALKVQRDKIVGKALTNLKGLTLSVVDGNFPREVLSSQNLTFASYTMPARRNSREFYDARTKKRTGTQPGTVYYGKVADASPDRRDVALKQPQRGTIFALLGAVLIGLIAIHRRA